MKYTPPLGSTDPDAPFVDGNPTAGIRGSVVPAAVFNQVQQELLAVIQTAGLEPAADNLRQLTDAIANLIASGAAAPQHGHAAADITSGTLPAARGGTGRTDGKAAALVTARTIDGVSFDGTANRTHYATCSTAAATAAKVVTLAGYVLATGARVAVRFTVTNTAANPTLNISDTGAKAVRYRDAAISAGVLAANRTYEFVYDGSTYQLVGDVDTGTTYKAGTGLALSGTTFSAKLNNTVTSTATDEAATANAVKLAYDAASSAQTFAGAKAPMPQSAAGVGQWVKLNNSTNGLNLTIPNGGVWAWEVVGGSNGRLITTYCGVNAGGSHLVISPAPSEPIVTLSGFAWRIA